MNAVSQISFCVVRQMSVFSFGARNSGDPQDGGTLGRLAELRVQMERDQLGTGNEYDAVEKMLRKAKDLASDLASQVIG